MTTDAKQIKPALSAEQWASDARAPRGTSDNMPRVMALANSDLPDDSPYKITRADLKAILLGVEGIQCCSSEYDYKEEHLAETRAEVAALQAVHDKLAALLPPE